MRRTRLQRIASISALLTAATVAMAACSSSSKSTPTTSAPTTSATTATTTSPTSSGSGGAGAAPSCFSGKLNAAGSTAQANAMAQWIKDYQKACTGATINYNASGSGDGVTEFNGGQVAFAGSDAALDPTAGEVDAAKKQCGSTPLDLPMVVGPIALGFKLSGVTKDLVLDAPTIAKIFLGKITTWNAPEITALNKGVTLPSTKITPFYRSDSSGTTKNFETYLAAAAPTDFTAKPDKDSSTAHFAGQGKSGSSAVAQSVSSTDGGIGYFEYSYATTSSLNTIDIATGASSPVAISATTASAAIATAKVTGTGNDLRLSIDYAQKADGAYPLVLVTYEVVCTTYKDSGMGTDVKDFLSYTVDGGQAALIGLGYAPLPTALQAKVKAAVAGIS